MMKDKKNKRENEWDLFSFFLLLRKLVVGVCVCVIFFVVSTNLVFFLCVSVDTLKCASLLRYVLVMWCGEKKKQQQAGIFHCFKKKKKMVCKEEKKEEKTMPE